MVREKMLLQLFCQGGKRRGGKESGAVIAGCINVFGNLPVTFVFLSMDSQLISGILTFMIRTRAQNKSSFHHVFLFNKD